VLNEDGKILRENLTYKLHDFGKKSLKIPKGKSEAVKRRRTDTTMAKRKRTNNDLQNITQKSKDQAKQTPLKTGGELR
jgi:hypothetical protein